MQIYTCIHIYVIIIIKEEEAINLRVGSLEEVQGRVVGKGWRTERSGENGAIFFQLKKNLKYNYQINA